MPQLRALAALASAPAALAAGGLRADPIVGSALQYLDGSDWLASAPADQTIYTGCEHFERGVDYGAAHPPSASEFPASSPEGCCEICGDLPGCVAGVFTPGGGRWKQGSCAVKSAVDVRTRRANNKTTACAPRRGPAGGLSLPAT